MQKTCLSLPRANPSLGMGRGGALFKQEGLQIDRIVVKTGVSGKEDQMDSKLKDNVYNVLPVWQKVFKRAVKIQCFICVFWF